MPLQFTQARTVRVGDPIKAGDMASLAQAVNSRLKSGVGDGVKRVAFSLFSGLFRKMRNDNGTLATPEAEFFNFYQHLNPDDAEWPVTEPGQAEGANVANHLNAFVFGSEALDIESERVRIGNVPSELGLPTGQEPNALDYWNLGKSQRGAYDPFTGDYSSPILALGTSYGYIRSSLTSPHGNTIGGYFPTAENAGGCAGIDDGNGGLFYPPNLQVFFTNLETGDVTTYCGTCPDDVGGTCPDEDRIFWVSYTPWAYIVFLYNGAVDYYPKSEWIEGPYTSDARLAKTGANGISRAVAQYVAEFRGDESQRAEPDMGQSKAFRMQEFLTEQYPLAPQIGTAIGEDVFPFYPTFSLNASGGLEVAAGTMALNSGGTEFTYPDNSVCTHVCAYCSGVESDSVTLTIKDDGAAVMEVTLTPDATGSDSRIVRLPATDTFAKLTVESTATKFADSSGIVAIEFNAVLAYRPQLNDAYAVLRLATYRGGIDKDGFGIEESESKAIYDNLETYGCVIPIAEPSAGLDVAVNQNAIYDAARRLSKCVRILPRHQLVGYALQDNKSVLYFRRWAFGMSHSVPIDMLEGIAPSSQPLTSLTAGRIYEVTSGFIVHNGEQINSGQTFTAVSAEFSGSGTVREENGIYDAYPSGYSNKWLIDFSFLPYYYSTSSTWKPDNYADIRSPFISRCLLDDRNISSDNTTLNHFSYGQRPVYFPDATSGFNYVPTPLSMFGDYANQGATSNFMKSCRIYEPPLEVQSATIDEQMSAEFGEDIVKVHLNSRVHHHDAAPASINHDVSTWNIIGLQDEVAEYRTTENAIREYILYEQAGRNCENAGAGDAAYDSSLPTSGGVFGTCFPYIFFVKQIPEPYLDGNTTYQNTDSPALSDHLRLSELYLRAMCEGFVDGRTSAAMACENSTTTLYDYTWENLNFDANSNRYVPLLPNDIREDNPAGHGPMPMTYFYAETFNHLAACVNRLRSARVMIPATLENRTKTYTETTTVTTRVVNATGALAVLDGFSKASGVDYSVALFTGSGGEGTESVGIWAAGTTAGAATSVDLSADATDVYLTTTRQTVEWRWSPTSSYEDALTDDVAALLEDSPLVVASLQNLQTIYSRSVVAGETNGTQCANSATTTHVWTLGAGSGQAAQWIADATTEDVQCAYISSFDSEPVPASWVYFSDTIGDVDPACGGGASRSTNITISVENTPAITVPVVSYEDGD